MKRRHKGRKSKNAIRGGGKGSGYEYWSPRAGNYYGGIPGRWSKTRTHRLERRSPIEVDA